MNEVVKYHNDMNSVAFRGFGKVELDLFFAICSKMRDEGVRMRWVYLPPDTLP